MQNDGFQNQQSGIVYTIFDRLLSENKYLKDTIKVTQEKKVWRAKIEIYLFLELVICILLMIT